MRRDGASVWDPPGATRYTTRDMLAVEARILHAAQVGRAAGVGVVSAETLAGAVAAERTPLGTDQYDALRGITGQGRRIEAVIGPAGTGKTTMLRVATTAWTDTGHQVIGLAHTAVAAELLRIEAAMPAETVAKYLDTHDRGAPPGWQLTPRHVVVVDEASMLATRDLDHLVALVTRHGAKLVLVGDDHQLGAIRDQAACSPPSPTPSARSSCARRTASPTLGKPTPSPNYATETPTGSAHSRRTGASTAVLNLKHNLTASPAGGPATTLGETRSCSPMTTPRHTNSPRKHERPAVIAGEVQARGIRCAPTSAPRPSAWATT